MTMPNTTKVIAIHEAMDKLWTDHVTWTRIVITHFDSNAPDLKPDLARLLRNQVDIGNAATVSRSQRRPPSVDDESVTRHRARLVTDEEDRGASHVLGVGPRAAGRSVLTAGVCIS
jgi:hypothetical protein